MISRKFNKLLYMHRITLFCRHKSEESINIEKLEQDAVVDVINDNVKVREEEIEQKRNKSRLKPQHYNIMHDKIPFPEPKIWLHGTVRYVRKMYGQYGINSGVDPSLCWPTKEELADKLEYERVAYPYTIPEVIESCRKKKEENEKQLQLRQQEIAEKMKKLEHWKTELRNKIAKKESEALAAKARKERLVEEVRRHFGYTVDPKDEKFKEMLEKKEKEQKKLLKEAKKKSKEEKMIASLLNKQVESAKLTK